MTKDTDATLVDHGSIVLLTPLSQEARDWITAYLPENTMRLGNAIAIERRYVPDIVEGLIADGITLAIA